MQNIQSMHHKAYLVLLLALAVPLSLAFKASTTAKLWEGKKQKKRKNQYLHLDSLKYFNFTMKTYLMHD